MRRRDERGAAVVWGIACIGLLTLMAMVGVAVGGLVAAHRRAQSAADLAALGGAQAAVRGRAPCAAATAVASANRARLAECRAQGGVVTVEVSLDHHGLFGQTHELLARSRAGPVGVG